MPSKRILNDDESFEAVSQSDDSIVGNYSVISYKNRIRLIELICIEKQQILHAASSLGIKISTAKYILRCFRKNGKVLRKSCQSKEEQEAIEKQIQALKEKVDQIKRNKKAKRQKLKKMEDKKVSSIEIIQEKKIEELEQLVVTCNENEKKNERIQENTYEQFNFPLMSQNMAYYLFYSPFWFPTNEFVLNNKMN